MRRFVRTSILIAAQVLVVLLLFEGALRLLAPRIGGLQVVLYHPSVQTEYDSVGSLEELLDLTPLGFVPHRVRDGFVLNSRSFRTKEYTGRKTEGAYRIMAIGDSFTYASGGVPGSRMWFAEMERELNRSSAREVEAFGLGAPGVGPRFELRLWELEHPLVRPDLVVLQFYTGNDFTDEQEKSLAPSAGGTLARRSYAYRLFRNLRRLYSERHSREQWLMAAAKDTTFERGGIELESEVPDDETPRFRESQVSALEAEHIRICLKANRARSLEIFAGVGEVLRRFAEEVRASGAEFLVMIVPTRFQIHPGACDLTLRRIRARPEDVDLDFPNEFLGNLLEEAEIPYVDLLPLFRECASTVDLYQSVGIHWSREGNLVAGRAMAEWVRSNALEKMNGGRGNLAEAP